MTLLYVSRESKISCMESMMDKIDMTPDYRDYLNSFAWYIIEIWAHLTPFSYVRLWSHFHRSFKIAPIAMMEILGLDPYQSQTQYLEGFFRRIGKRKQSGNVVATLLPLCFHFFTVSGKKRTQSRHKAETCCRFRIHYLQRG
jgi:hypothetical protein